MIKKYQGIVTGLFLIGLQASTLYANPLFKQQYQQLINQHLPNAATGLVIQEVDSKEAIFDHRGKENFYPASNTKLFTASAALKFFGPNFQYQTSFHAPLDKIQDNILKDNLYVIFRGDPSLSVHDLSALLKQLKVKGVHQIQGNIIIDDKSFATPLYGPGWTWDSIPWYYSAPISSIILNENKVRIKLHKPNALYELLKIEQADERIPNLPIDAHVMVVTPEEAKNVCQLSVNIKNNKIQLTGCWSIDKTPAYLELAIDEPRLLAQQTLLEQLKKSHIQLNGEIVFEKAPKDVPAILIKKSPPLKNMLFKVLGESNNIYTESLTKALGKVYGGQGTFQAGTLAILEILKKDTPLDFSQVHLSDGSGLSRYNLISPHTVSQLLTHMHDDVNFEIFYNALSQNGKNGTLADRMKQKNMLTKIVAKTGSATGMTALSGYFKGDTTGKLYTFSFMVNQYAHNPYTLKSVEDKLCQLMLKEPWVDASTPTTL